MNRKPQPASKSDAQKKLAAAYRATYAIGVFLLFIGLPFAIFAANTLEGAIAAVLLFIFGAVYVLLGWLVQRKLIVALRIAVAIMVSNLLGGIYNVFQAG